MTTQPNQKTIQYRLHPEQLQVYHSEARFNIVEAGRRWGKTELAWIKALIFMLSHPNCLIWWISPFYKELSPATKKIRNLTPRTLIEKTLESGEVIRYIRLTNGAECYFHSADKEDSLRGSGLHGVVVDEAPKLKRNRWEAEIKPSLIDYNGWGLFIGTPLGKTWFSEIKAKGSDPQQTDYKSFHFSSYGNAIENGGFLPKQNIDAIANDMPEMLKRQEIFAEELEGEGVVFRHIADRIHADIQPFHDGETVVVGSDIAKQKDYYVNIALRMNGEVVGFERFNKLDYPFMRKRTINFCHNLNNAYLLIDSTGVGDPVYDEITREYINVDGYKLTNATKKALIENLSIMLDNDEIHFPGNPETKEFSNSLDPEFPVLKSELESFAYELSPSHNVIYSAPEGLHDDTVIALALAAWQLKSGGGNVEIGFAPRNRR